MNKTIALSARGGGGKCASYIGFLLALQEAKIPVDMIIGSSGGITALMPYAFGYTIGDTIQFAKEIRNSRFINWRSLANRTLWDAQSWNDYFRDIFDDKDLNESQIKSFVQLSATNRTSVVKTDGSVSRLLIATLAYPGLLPKQKIDNEYYYDGDLTSNFDVEFLRSQKAEFIIGLSVGEKKRDDSDELDLSIENLGLRYSEINFGHVDELVERGYEIGLKNIQKINDLMEG